MSTKNPTLDRKDTQQRHEDATANSGWEEIAKRNKEDLANWFEKHRNSLIDTNGGSSEFKFP